MTEVVTTEVRGRVLLVTLNRPNAMNAINRELAEGLVAAMERLDGDDDLAAGVLAGSGRGFCAGMDLKEFAEAGEPKALTEFYRRGAEKPLVCAIEGFALAGGFEVALTCDLLVAARGTKLGLPEVGVGLFAAGGALARLPRRVPYGVAVRLALTGDPMTAEETYPYGLIAELTERGDALDVALQLADRITRNAPRAVAATKQLIRQGSMLSEEEYWRVQQPLWRSVSASADAQEGARAFAEKRTPSWTGR